MKANVIASLLGLLFTTSPLSATSYSYEGVNDKGDLCTIELTVNNDGELEKIGFNGKFVVDYHIPAPFSGLYGKYYWEQNHSFLKDGKVETYHVFDPLKVELGLFSSDIIVKTAMRFNPDMFEGKDNNFNVTYHRINLKGEDFDSLTAFTYSGKVKLVRIVPFVSSELKCRQLVSK